VPDAVRDDQAVFLSDAAPTGFMGADFCGLRGGETVAVWGCGAVGLMAQRSAYLLGAARVIAIAASLTVCAWRRTRSGRKPQITQRLTA
jgi:threonine dehydrogenase-like Zn-dependent dehydrogenase